MTEDTMPLDPQDLAAIAASEALLDALAAGNGTASAAAESDPTARLLREWRHELDDRAVTLAAFEAAPVPAASGPRRWTRTHRRTAAAAALALALAASTGVAAAESGSTGPWAPLHRLFFGATQQPHDQAAVRATALLQQAASGIAAARDAGGITVAGRATISHLLDRAAAILGADPDSQKALTERVSNLRAALAGLPLLPSGSPGATTPGGGSAGAVPDDHGGRNPGSGDHDGTRGTSDHGGTSGSGDGSGSGGGSGHDGGDTSTSGSDGGSTGSDSTGSGSTGTGGGDSGISGSGGTDSSGSGSSGGSGGSDGGDTGGGSTLSGSSGSDDAHGPGLSR